jgi:hypothetical protein
MVNVALDDVTGNGLGGRWDEEVYYLDPKARLLMKLSTSGRGLVITKQILSRGRGIGLELAKKTLNTTTQADEAFYVWKGVGTLSRWWGIGLELAKKTLNTTTQAGIWKLMHPAER